MKRVLVVDDDVSVQRHCREILSAEGFEVHTEASLGSTRRFLRNQGADVLLLDLFLPDGCGFDLFKSSADLVEGIPIVGMTAVYRGSANARLITLRYPFVSILEKPVGVAAVVEVLRSILGDSYPAAPDWARADDQLVAESPVDLESELDAIDEILNSQAIDAALRAAEDGEPTKNAMDPMTYSGAFVSPLDQRQGSDSNEAAALEWDPTKDISAADVTRAAARNAAADDDEPTTSSAISDMIDSLKINAVDDEEREESTVVTGPPPMPSGYPNDDEPTTGALPRRPVAPSSGGRSRYPPVRDGLIVPPQLDPRRVALQGRLEATPFPTILAHLARQGQTGTLLLRRDQVKKIVFLQDGVPRAVKSNLVYECLGQILVREDLISEQACALSVERLKAERRPQGEILVEMGVLSESSLEYALEKQFDLKIFDIFTWGIGLYQFRDLDTVDATGYTTPRNPFALVMAGMRSGFPADRINFDLAVFQSHAPVLLVGARELDLLGLNEKEKSWIPMMDGRSLSQLASTPGVGSEVTRLVYALACLGLLGFATHQPSLHAG